VLPSEGKPVYSSYWTFKSEAYTDVVDGIEKVLLQKKEQKENIIKEKKQQKIQVDLEEKRKSDAAKKQQEELADWEKTKADNKITVYQKFIKKYPKSQFNQTANNKIKQLRSKNKKAKQKKTITKSTTPTFDLKSPKLNLKTTPKVISQADDEDVLLEKGSIILQRSFFASLPVLGAALIVMLGIKFNNPTIDSIMNSTFFIVAIMIGIILILVYQLILMADDFSYIVDEGTETKEISWGIVLTFISFGIISALGILFLQMIINSF